jgi:cytochrome b subunit of formate dehydrogenase
MSQPHLFPRFSVTQRLEHWVAVISFTVLAVTGLPQKFVGAPWAESMIAVLGGIETVRLIHRYAAIILLLETIYHGGAITYKVLVQRVGMSMMLGWKDMTDLFAVMAYNLGLRKEHPKLPRYNFEEKMEYWAFVWGTVVMAMTGFMLWNPIATAKLLPGSFIPAAKAAHGGEALLAVLAIIVWHFYGVHLRKLNKSMFTGSLTRAEMLHDHALELEAIENGTARPAEPAAAIARRAKRFIPAAAVISAALLFATYLFVTFEETAIPTVAAAENSGNGFKRLEIAANGGSLHATITAFTGPESCAAAGCHNEAVIESAAASAHSRRIAAAGPSPLLAHFVPDSAAAITQAAPDCLQCHAKEYQAANLTASAQTVRAAGGKTCLRCHNSQPENDVHAQAGLACVSCHPSANHEIQTQADCRQCHNDLPHPDPILNTKHQRLDCRACHAPAAGLLVQVSQPVQNSVTGFYQPAITVAPGPAAYAWQKAGQPAAIDTDGALITPVLPVTLAAPAQFDPVAFAQTGQAAGVAQDTTVTIVPSHGISKDSTRTCQSCHGPTGTFGFAALGYPEDVADNLSARPSAPVE